MSGKKIGRPTDSLKNTMIRVRMDEDMVKKLDICVDKLNSNRSEVIRSGINKMYDDLNEKK